MPQTYSDGNKIYSVDVMFAYVNIFKPKYVKLNVNDFLHVLDYKGWGNPNKKIFYSANDVINSIHEKKVPKKYKEEYDRIKNANLKYPIIVNGKHVVDGVHRLSKSALLGKKQIKCYIFDDKLMNSFILDKNKNWKKVDELKIHDFIQSFYKNFGK